VNKKETRRPPRLDDDLPTEVVELDDEIDITDAIVRGEFGGSELHLMSLRQCRVEPVRARLVDRAVMQSGQRDIERHDAHRPVRADGIMHRAGVRQIIVVPESAPESVAIVVIAGDDQRRDLEPAQQRPQLGVFGRRALVDQVAAQQHEIGPRIERVKLGDRGSELRVGAGDILVKQAVGPHMRVGELGDQHSAVRPAVLLEPVAALRRQAVDAALDPLEPAVMVLAQDRRRLGRFGRKL